MDGTLLTLGIQEEEIAVLVISLTGGLLFIWLLLSNMRRMLETRAKESTRREIAAYVAEGSITPDDARALLESGNGADLEKKIGDAVAWGTISAKKAEGLIRAAREGKDVSAQL